MNSSSHMPDPPDETTDDDSPPGVASNRTVATAYHEAGHALMALIVGRTVQKVTISPGQIQTGGVRLGACQMKKGRTKSPKDWLEDEVLILLAGMIAESHFTGEYCELGAKQDLLAVKRLLGTRAQSERQLVRSQQRMLDKAEHELSDEGNVRAIALIAKELLARHTISGRSVQHIYEQTQT